MTKRITQDEFTAHNRPSRQCVQETYVKSALELAVMGGHVWGFGVATRATRSPGQVHFTFVTGDIVTLNAWHPVYVKYA